MSNVVAGTAPATGGEVVPGTPGAGARVIIVGAGFGGLAAAKALAREARRLGRPTPEITVVDRLNYHLFQPLLYQVALAGLAATDIAYPIRSALRRYRHVGVLLGEVKAIDVDARQIRLEDGSSLGYDFLVVAAGASTAYFGHDDWARFAPGLKDLDDALVIRRRVLVALEAAERARDPAERRRMQTFVIVGGGATGVELAGAIADLSRDILAADFRRLSAKETRVVLVEAGERILAPFEPAHAGKARAQLEELGVEVRTGVRVENIDERGVTAGGELLPAGTVLWGAGVRPNALARELGLPLDRGGRVLVGPDCSVAGHPELFVIGDMASFTPAGDNAPLPGISPVAIQQGRSVAANIARDLRGRPRVPFRYRDKGFMATIGRARAVARLGRLRLSGFPAWATWVGVHLWYLVGFRNRLAVFTNWIWAYVVSRHGARVITGHPLPPPALSPSGDKPSRDAGAGTATRAVPPPS